MNCVDAEEVFRESLSESFFSDEFYTEMELLEPVGEPLTGEQLLADPEHRWRMVTSLYIGDTIWIDEYPMDDQARNSFVARDTLVDCWRPEFLNSELEGVLMQFDERYTPQRRADLRLLAEINQ